MRAVGIGNEAMGVKGSVRTPAAGCRGGPAMGKCIGQAAGLLCSAIHLPWDTCPHLHPPQAQGAENTIVATLEADTLLSLQRGH